MKLIEHAFDQYSQFGEDGCLERVFELTGEGNRVCVEFGAGDGFDCSNTAWLREHHWSATLIEADRDRYERLIEATQHSSEEVVNTYITPGNIDELLPNDIDFISIDVDGNDYAIWEAMTKRPRVVCIEYNASIPPHVSLRQRDLGSNFGASALALCELGVEKGYGLIGLTKGNLIFVTTDLLPAFSHYDQNLLSLFDYSALSYLSTDFQGRPVATGAMPPWGLRPVPCVRALEGEHIPLRWSVAATREGYEATYGKGRFLGQQWRHNVSRGAEAARTALLRALEDNPPVVIMDISHHPDDETFDWAITAAAAHQYRSELVPGCILAFIDTSTEEAL